MYSFTFCIQLCGCLRQGEIANRIRFKRWALLRQRFIGLWRQLQRSWCRLLNNRYLHTVSNRPCRRFWSRFVGCGVLLHALVLQQQVATSAPIACSYPSHTLLFVVRRRSDPAFVAENRQRLLGNDVVSRPAPLSLNSPQYR